MCLCPFKHDTTFTMTIAENLYTESVDHRIKMQ